MCISIIFNSDSRMAYNFSSLNELKKTIEEKFWDPEVLTKNIEVLFINNEEIKFYGNVNNLVVVLTQVEEDLISSA